jgi:hypothetical protein
VFAFIGGLEMSRRICSPPPAKKEENQKIPTENGKGKKTKEEEICEKHFEENAEGRKSDVQTGQINRFLNRR